jgi:hypothetical protein
MGGVGLVLKGCIHDTSTPLFGRLRLASGWVKVGDEHG